MEVAGQTERTLCGRIAVAWLAFFSALAAAACLCGGCVPGKGSHQNGIILGASTSAGVYVGYGECEDVPPGAVYYRYVENTGPAFWADGTNRTVTVTFWDTRTGATNLLETRCGRTRH